MVPGFTPPVLLRPPASAGRVVLAGAANSGLFMSADDGLSWTARTSNGSPLTGWTGGVWTGSQFCIVGGLGFIETSPDTSTWTARTSDMTNSGGSKVTINSVAWSGSTFLIAGAYTGSPKVAAHQTSSTGASWTSRSYGGGIAVPGVRYVNSKFLTYVAGATYQTTDGVSYSSFTNPITSGMFSLTACAYGAGLYVFVGGGTSVCIRSSPDLATWTTRSTLAVTLNDVTFGNSLFVAVGTNSTILTSSDGQTWTARTSAVSAALYGVIWNGAVFIVVGAGGTIQTSPDGTTWTARTSGTTSALQFVC